MDGNPLTPNPFVQSALDIADVVVEFGDHTKVDVVVADAPVSMFGARSVVSPCNVVEMLLLLPEPGVTVAFKRKYHVWPAGISSGVNIVVVAVWLATT